MNIGSMMYIDRFSKCPDLPGAELKVMNEIEKKCPGTFFRGIREKTSDLKGFDTDRMILKEEELSYAIGKEAATQKKLEKAAGCILQFVGRCAFIAGTIKERRRCREFISWLLQHMRGAVTISDISHRDDATEMHIPSNCKALWREKGVTSSGCIFHTPPLRQHTMHLDGDS